MTMNINNPKAAEYHWKNVSVYGFDFEIPLSPKGDYLQDQNVPLAESIENFIKEYESLSDELSIGRSRDEIEDSLESLFDILKDDLEYQINNYGIQNRHNRTLSFRELLYGIKSIELLADFFINIKHPERIPKWTVNFTNRLPDDLKTPEIISALTKSTQQSTKQPNISLILDAQPNQDKTAKSEKKTNIGGRPKGTKNQKIAERNENIRKMEKYWRNYGLRGKPLYTQLQDEFEKKGQKLAVSTIIDICKFRNE